MTGQDWITLLAVIVSIGSMAATVAMSQGPRR